MIDLSKDNTLSHLKALRILCCLGIIRNHVQNHRLTFLAMVSGDHVIYGGEGCQQVASIEKLDSTRSRQRSLT
jgi:hypothetical protein